jgi:hypothetical protein
MSDRPWLQESDPSLRGERELLKQLNAQKPPAGSVDQGWAALWAAPGVKAAAATSSTTGAFGLAAKIGVGVAVAGAAIWAGSRFLAPDKAGPVTRPPAPIAAPAAITTSQPAAALPGPAEPPPSELITADKPAPGTRPPTSLTTLGEEGRLVSRAHQLIQSGQGGEALKVLRMLESRYPRSVLSQEREVLTIEALGATGDSAAARARAKRFLERFPKSPHAARLQRFAE